MSNLSSLEPLVASKDFQLGFELNGFFSSQFDFQKFVEEILKQMRGTLSQRTLSEKMGFSFNQVGKWETGVTRIKWWDFLEYCKVLQIPSEKTFRFAFWTMGEEFTLRNTIVAIDIWLGGSGKGSDELKLKLKRWLREEISPDFAEIIQVMAQKPLLLFGWLGQLLDCRLIPSVAKAFEDYLRHIDSVFNSPVVIYVHAALHLESYKSLRVHSDKLLARHAACSIEELSASLQILLNFQLVRFENGKYIPNSFDFSFAGLRHPKLRKFTSHTTNLTARRYSESPSKPGQADVKNPAMSSVRVAALSVEAAKKVLDLLAQLHRDIGDIEKNDSLPKDNVQVVLIHTYPTTINAPE